MQRKEHYVRSMIGDEVAVRLQVKRINHETCRIERDRPVCTRDSQQDRRQVINHRHLDRVGIRQRAANTVVTEVVGRNRNHTAAESQVLHSFEGRVDVGKATGKGHQRIVGTIADRECQATGAVQRKRAVGSLQRQLHRIVTGIHVRDEDRIASGRGEDERSVERYVLRAGNMIDRRIVDWIDRHSECPDESVHSTVGRAAIILHGHRDQNRSVGIRHRRETDRAGGVRAGVGSARVRNQRRIARSSRDGQGLSAFITRPRSNPSETDGLQWRILINNNISQRIKRRRVIECMHGNRKCLRRGSIDAAQGRAAAVLQPHRHRGHAIKTISRRKGQRACRADGRLHREDRVVIVRDQERQGLRRLIGRAG